MRIIGRSEWGAAAPRYRTTVAWTKDDLWVHYSAGHPPAANTVAAESRLMRGIQGFHMGPERGWSDIGYHFVVMPSGRIYEGRGFNVFGSHCPGHNSEPSVCIPWNDKLGMPPAAALESVMALARHLGKTGLKGHRDGFSTSCPGDALYRWVQQNRVVPRAATRTTVDLDSAAYLRLDINGQVHIGWTANLGRLRWIAKNGLKTQRCGIAFRGPGRKMTETGKWQGPVDVTDVCRALLRTYD